jgi:plastocyanin
MVTQHIKKIKFLIYLIPISLIFGCGGGGGGGSSTPEPTANTAPTISTSVTSYGVIENSTAVTTISATDAQGDSLSYSLTGSDASSFSISGSGTITFSSAPDYEVAGDTNSDNVYEVSVVVSDGRLSASLGLVITVNNDTSDDVAQGPLLLETKVIDGYISGANVFIDFNWNLSQDEGEPSATEDSINQVYNFEETDFASINNFTVDCAKLRPRIAEIPAGAVDADQGVVDSPFNLYFFPWYGDSASNRANVTPLTSLFTNYLESELNTGLNASISVAEGCGEAANTIGQNIEGVVAQVMTSLAAFGIDPNKFYDDYIASNDEQLQSFGETVASYLKLTYGVSLLLEQEYGVNMRTSIDRLLIENLLSSNIPEVFEFALFSETPETEIGDGWTESTLYAVYDIYGNAAGELLTSNDGSGVVYEATLENLLQNTDFVARERKFYQSLEAPLFEEVKVLLESGNSRGNEYQFIDMGSFEIDDCLTRYLEYETNPYLDGAPSVEMHSCLGGKEGQPYGNLLITNMNNPVIEDLDFIFSNRSAQDILGIYNKIKGLAQTVDTMELNRSLLLDGDIQTLILDGYIYEEKNNNGSFEQKCTNTTTNTIFTGSEAYEACLNLADPIPSSTSITVDVGVAANQSGSGNVYVIDGEQRKSITLIHGNTYTFNHSSSHPLKFSTTDDGTHAGGTEYTDGVDTSSSGVTVITVTADMPSTLYYYCEIHSGMGGTATISAS